MAGRAADPARAAAGWPAPRRPAPRCRSWPPSAGRSRPAYALHTLWYAVYGFRFDASRVLAGDADSAPTIRAGLLVLAALGAGMLLIIGGFLVHIRGRVGATTRR